MDRSHSAPRRKPLTSPHLRAVAWRWRWVGAAILVAAIVKGVMAAVVPDAVATRDVVVTSRPVISGQTLVEGDLKVVAMPADLAADGMFADASELVGRSVVAPLPEGAPIYQAQILSTDFLKKIPPGTVVTSIELLDNGMLDMIDVGSRVDIYAPPSEFSEESEAILVAKDVLIVAATRKEGESSIIREVADTLSFHVAIEESQASLVLGIGA